MVAEKGHPNRCYAWMGEISPEIGAVAMAVLKPGDTFLDIGAFSGQYSIRAANAVGEQGLVVAIEPDPRNLVNLRRNVSLSGCKDVVQIRTIAVAAESGNKIFHLHPSLSMSSLDPDFHGQNYKQVNIETVTVASLQDELDPHLIKMDVEGVEPSLIENLRSSQKHNGPLVIAEDNPGVRRAFIEKGWWCTSLQKLIKTESPARGAYGSIDVIAGPSTQISLEALSKRINLEVTKLISPPKVHYRF